MTILTNVNGLLYPKASTISEAKRLFDLEYESIHTFVNTDYLGVAHNMKEFKTLQNG